MIKTSRHNTNILKKLVNTFKSSKPLCLDEDSTMRASVALILRIKGLPNDCYSNVKDLSLNSIPSRLLELSTSDNTELLYIKRWERQGDPWSGNVAFPGGKSEKNESDYETAIRETREEINLDLTDGFICLGQLNEAPIYGSGKRRKGSVFVPFVFLLVNSEETLPLTLQQGEVLSARWVKLSYLSNGVDYRVQTSFRGPSFVGLDKMYWPSIDFPTPLETNTTSASPTSFPLLAMKEQAREYVQFRLWGMTLRATIELLEKCGLEIISETNSKKTSVKITSTETSVLTSSKDTLSSSEYPKVRFDANPAFLNPLASIAVQLSFTLTEMSRRVQARSLSLIVWTIASLSLFKKEVY